MRTSVMRTGTTVTQDGLADCVAGLVATDDGAITLGAQRTVVRHP